MSNSKLKPTKPVLVLLYGFPGAGKSHFARNISEHLECAVVNGDRIRYELFDRPQYDKQENDIVKHLMGYMSEEFLNAGVSVVYDMNAMRRAQRHELREMARKKHAKTILVWFQLDADTAYGRLGNRDRRTADDKYAMDYTQSEFREFVSHMQHPSPTEDYVVVSGKHTFGSQKTAFFKKLIEMGLVDSTSGQSKVAKPGLINLVPHNRVDMTRRNINIR